MATMANGRVSPANTVDADHPASILRKLTDRYLQSWLSPANTVDADQPASKEADWSVSTKLAKRGEI